MQAQPQPVTKPQMNTEQLSRNQKKISPRTREDASWERAHLACSVNREAVSTLEACAGGRTKILSKKQRILRLVIASRPHTAEGREPPMSGAEHRRASAFIGGFKQLRLFHFSFMNHASRTKFDHFVNFVSTKWT